MSGTRGVAIKAAIMAALKGAPGLEGVQVTYSPGRDMEREWVFGGSVEMSQTISAGRDADGHTTRDEKGVLEIHIQVRAPGADHETTEGRAVELGEALEDFLSLNTPDMPAGTLDASVEGYVLNSWFDDDAAITQMTYRIGTEMTIT